MMKFVLATKENIEQVKDAYKYIISNSVDMDKYARWEYGKHPTDEKIEGFVRNNNMYMMTDEDKIVGVVALTFGQEEDYHPFVWQKEFKDEDIIVPHLFGINPDYTGQGVGKQVMHEIIKLGKEMGLKACRLDTLASNIPAQSLYTKLGFTYIGKANWYAVNTGWTDFLLYEYVF